MKITLNGLELARRAEGDLTIGKVLAEIADDIHRGGKMITQIAIDGRIASTDWQRNRLFAQNVSDVHVMDLMIDDPLRLRRQTVGDAIRLIEKLIEQSRPLGRKFRLGEEVTANNDLASYLDDLKWIIAGLDISTRDTAQDLAQSARSRIMETANRLLPTLDRIYKAQAAGDYIAIADELEYDLCDQLKGWTPLMTEVQGSLELTEQEN